MDEMLRLKIKVGVHEFEAEGPAAVVNEQFQAWKELVVYSPASEAPYAPLNAPTGDVPATIQPARPADVTAVDTQLPKIMRAEGRVISLTVRAKTVDDAVLLILYGQKVLRDNDAITGGEVMEGLTATGGTSVGRVDRLLEKLGRDGDAIVIGERRGKRYRLTNAGITKARQLASDLIAIVA
jgi:hypothetical protein